jgi:CheY-like chemotaxis protein
MLDFRAHLLLPRVLLIDDDMVSREVLATVLTMSGYTIHTAVDGEAALKLLESKECAPEVILMDTQMPGLSGLALLKKLRASTKAVVFAISGSEAPDEVVAAADGFLLKPFGSEALRKALEERGTPARQAAAEAAKEEAPVVAPEVLARLREMMPEASVREIYFAVVADLGRRTEALEAAIAKRDSGEIRRIGHAIKGGCAMAGAAQAAKLGAQLEAGSDQLDNIPVLVRDLHSATRDLQRMLKVEFPA